MKYEYNKPKVLHAGVCVFHRYQTKVIKSRDLRERSPDPNDMIDYVSENLAKIVTRELAKIVKDRIRRIERKWGPMSKRDKKILARYVLVKKVKGVTKKVHDEVS